MRIAAICEWRFQASSVSAGSVEPALTALELRSQESSETSGARHSTTKKARDLSLFPHTQGLSADGSNNHLNAKKKCILTSLPSHILLTEYRAAQAMLLQGMSPLASSFHAAHAL